MKSIQSALGYTNIMLNMQDIFWPEQETDRWEIMQKQFASNLLTYWKNFSCFSNTTLSQSDARVRTVSETGLQVIPGRMTRLH